MNSKIKSIWVLIFVIISGCSNSEYPQAKPTQFNIDNTATVFIGSENITIPIPSEFEKGSKNDEKIQLLINPIPDKNTEILATLSKANEYFVIISNPFKSINTDKYTSESNFKKLNKRLLEFIKNDLKNITNNPKYKEMVSKLEQKTGLYTINRSPINNFIDGLNTFGYSNSFDVLIIDNSLNQFKRTKVSHAVIMLRVKEKMLSVRVIGSSKSKHNMEYVKQLSKKLATQIISLNNGSLATNPNTSDSIVKSIDVDYTKELKNIKDLLDSGIIDNTEFKKMKQKIINKM
jgi:hypothetical protein